MAVDFIRLNDPVANLGQLNRFIQQVVDTLNQQTVTRPKAAQVAGLIQSGGGGKGGGGGNGGVCIYYVDIPAGLGGADGKVTIAHGAGVLPAAVILETEIGAFWFQPVYYDDTNLFLVASDATAAGRAKIVTNVTCGNVPPITSILVVGSFEAPYGFIENGGGLATFVDSRQVFTKEIISQATVTVLTNHNTGPATCGGVGPGWPTGGDTELAWVTDPAPLTTGNIGTVVSGPNTVAGNAANGSVTSFDPFVVPAGYYVGLRLTNKSECNDCTSPTGFCDHFIQGCAFNGPSYKRQVL